MDEQEWEDDDFCADCGSFLSWVDCWNGCEDGLFDEWETDAINFAPGQCYRRCDVCKGSGGWLICGSCHPRAVEV